MAQRDIGLIEIPKPELYSDFLSNLEKNPFSGTLGRITNEDCVKQSIRNLFLTNSGERLYNSIIGGNITKSLFEVFDLANIEVVKLDLTQMLNTYEPRAEIVNLNIHEAGLDNNELVITVIFKISNIQTEEFSVDIFIKRVR